MVLLLSVVLPLCVFVVFLAALASGMSYYFVSRRRRRKPYTDFNEECARLGADMRRKSQISLAMEEKQKLKLPSPKHFPQNTLHPNDPLAMAAVASRDRRNTLHQFLNIPQQHLGVPSVEDDQVSLSGTANTTLTVPASPSRNSIKSVGRSPKASPTRRFSALPSFGQSLLGVASPQSSQSMEENNKTPTHERRLSSVGVERFSITEPFLDPRMYRLGDLDPSHASLNQYRSGKLCFSLHFDQEKKRLHVTVHKAHYLPSHSPKQTSCYYVKLTLLPDEQVSHKTALVSTNSNPIFEQTFAFTVVSAPAASPHREEEKEEQPGFEARGGEEKSLQFTVKEAQHLEKNRIIGFVWVKLHDGLLARDSLESLWRDIISPSKGCDGVSAEVLVNMRYHLASKTLTVQVEEAKHLPVRQHDGSVYCRISLMTEERVLRSKRTPSVKEDLANPSMQGATVSFHMDQYLNQKSNDPRGGSSNSVDDVCIVVYICSRSTVGFSHLIGKTVIGPMRFTDGEGVLHWSEVWEKPDTNILRWHILN